MTIKPKYTKYNKRVFNGLLRAFFLSIFYILILFSSDIGYFAKLIISIVFAVLFILLTINGIKRSKLFLYSITINESDCILEIYEKDLFKEKIELKLSETKIKIFEVFFGEKIGGNFKLVISSKEGNSFKKVFQQIQIGDWNRIAFNKVINLYNDKKGLSDL